MSFCRPPSKAVTHLSDAEYIVSKFCAAEYAIVGYFVDKAETHDSLAVRWRLYFIAMRVPLAIADNVIALTGIKQAMEEFRRCLKIEPESPQEFLLPYVLDETTAEDCSAKKRKSEEGKSQKYKEEHFEIFSRASLVWPPTFQDTPEIDRSLMHERVQELAYYLHKLYPFQGACPEPTCQFFDGNLSVKRLLHWSVEEREAKVEHPWKKLMPNITSQSQIVVRYIGPDGIVENVRQVHGYELMLFQGWPRDRLNQLNPYSHKQTT